MTPEYSHRDIERALTPIASLLSKSEKAREKLAPGTWQHTMLTENIAALRLATALMTRPAEDHAESAGDEPEPTADELEAALRALDSMIERTEKAGAKFEPGTSQHSLSRNRLEALRVARAFVSARSSAAS